MLHNLILSRRGAAPYQRIKGKRGEYTIRGVYENKAPRRHAGVFGFYDNAMYQYDPMEDIWTIVESGYAVELHRENLSIIRGR